VPGVLAKPLAAPAKRTNVIANPWNAPPTASLRLCGRADKTFPRRTLLHPIILLNATVDISARVTAGRSSLCPVSMVYKAHDPKIDRIVAIKTILLAGNRHTGATLLT